MMSICARDVTVVGGGIGGMAVALLLARSGASVTLLERAPGPAAVGAGILLQPNGLAVLQGLGLRSHVEARGTVLDRMVVRNHAGSPISELRTPDFGHGLAHVVAVRRSALHEVLADALASESGVDCRYECEATAVDSAGTVDTVWRGRTATLASNLVVGADGVHSRVRASGDFGASTGRGSTYVRGLVPTADPTLEGEYWTPLGLFGGAPVDPQTQYFYAAADAGPLAAAITNQDITALRLAWSTQLPLAESVLARVPRFEDLLVNTVTRVDCRTWYDGRLVLLGDAAHAMEPTLGQGANSALVDAAILTDQLTQASSLSSALEVYTSRRLRPVKRIQNRAENLAKASRLASPTARRSRDLVMRMLGRLPGASSRLTASIQQEDPAQMVDLVFRTMSHSHET